MTSALDLLEEVRLRGANLRVREDGALVLTPAGRIPNELRDALRASREDVIAILQEWRVGNCNDYVVLATADAHEVRTSGVCLRCGAPWLLHGSPVESSWVRIAKLDSVSPIAARLVMLTPLTPPAQGEVAR